MKMNFRDTGPTHTTWLIAQAAPLWRWRAGALKEVPAGSTMAAGSTMRAGDELQGHAPAKALPRRMLYGEMCTTP